MIRVFITEIYKKYIRTYRVIRGGEKLYKISPEVLEKYNYLDPTSYFIISCALVIIAGKLSAYILSRFEYFNYCSFTQTSEFILFFLYEYVYNLFYCWVLVPYLIYKILIKEELKFSENDLKNTFMYVESTQGLRPKIIVIVSLELACAMIPSVCFEENIIIDGFCVLFLSGLCMFSIIYGFWTYFIALPRIIFSDFLDFREFKEKTVNKKDLIYYAYPSTGKDSYLSRFRKFMFLVFVTLFIVMLIYYYQIYLINRSLLEYIFSKS